MWLDSTDGRAVASNILLQSKKVAQLETEILRHYPELIKLDDDQGANN